MEILETKILLPEGNFEVKAQSFVENDRIKLRQIYHDWVNLSNELQSIGGRRINVPEALSEGIYCIHFNSVRILDSIPGANSSFDCYNLDSKKRIQVKACSVESDLTSFGPKSVWDEIYLIHLYPNKKYDGKYKIYLIENDLIYNHKVNKNQIMKDQQSQGKRPRFSIIDEIIIKKNIKPVIEAEL